METIRYALRSEADVLIGMVNLDARFSPEIGDTVMYLGEPYVILWRRFRENAGPILVVVPEVDVS